ncbi:MAG: PLDc N-terminal domain-containing protein [Thermoproteales archaeon]|nr:PLDc N-terminal domain-containing protein [Thermoproteales archaeon]
MNPLAMVLALITSATMLIFPFITVGIALFFYLAMFILWIAVVIWVYKDAEKRGENGVLWLLVVLVGGIIGLIVYLILREEKLAKTV